MVVGVPKDHPTKGDPGLTLVEAQSHFSMWCMFPAMLMATNDVRKRDKDIENILFNKETIAVNRTYSTCTSHAISRQRLAPIPRHHSLPRHHNFSSSSSCLPLVTMPIPRSTFLWHC
jgi:hypothetical protein